jgi:hypothetical protein
MVPYLSSYLPRRCHLEGSRPWPDHSGTYSLLSLSGNIRKLTQSRPYTHGIAQSRVRSRSSDKQQGEHDWTAPTARQTRPGGGRPAVSDEHEPRNSRPRPVSQPVAGGTAVNCRSGGCRRITLAVDAHGLTSARTLSRPVWWDSTGCRRRGGAAAPRHRWDQRHCPGDATGGGGVPTPPGPGRGRAEYVSPGPFRDGLRGVAANGWWCRKTAQGRAELAGGSVIVLGIVLLVVGYFLAIPILWTLGIILVVIGVILVLLGTAGHAIGGRRHYY